MSVLVIYTASFPYRNSETFLETEIKFLALSFGEIFIIPSIGKGKIRDLPGNVKVLSPIKKNKWSVPKIYLTGLFFYHEIFKIPELEKEIGKISFSKLVKYWGYAVLTKKRLYRRITPDISLHYSYWLDFSAFSLSLLKRDGIIKKCISRAHGFDLYEERGEKSLTFIRETTLKNLDKIFLISMHGLNYLYKKYPHYSSKYAVSRLGTSDPGVLNPLPENVSLTIVSCSVINCNKRIDLILDSLISFKKKFSSASIKWYHIGTGEEIDRYQEKAKGSFNGTNVECVFSGSLTNREIFEFYSSIPIDFFINVSRYEGLPVSIMEAHSFSIPVIATNVGGTSEIVNDDNGILLPPDPEPVDLADIYHNILMNKETWMQKRHVSRKWWEQNFNADINYKSFSQELLNLAIE